MDISGATLSVGLSVVGSLIAAGILWMFRRQVKETLAALDMSAGAVIGWVMAFIMLAVIIVFPLVGKDIPSPITSVFILLVGFLIGSTIWGRK